MMTCPQAIAAGLPGRDAGDERREQCNLAVKGRDVEQLGPSLSLAHAERRQYRGGGVDRSHHFDYGDSYGFGRTAERTGGGHDSALGLQRQLAGGGIVSGVQTVVGDRANDSRRALLLYKSAIFRVGRRQQHDVGPRHESCPSLACVCVRDRASEANFPCARNRHCPLRGRRGQIRKARRAVLEPHDRGAQLGQQRAAKRRRQAVAPFEHHDARKACRRLRRHFG